MDSKKLGVKIKRELDIDVDAVVSSSEGALRGKVNNSTLQYMVRLRTDRIPPDAAKLLTELNSDGFRAKSLEYLSLFQESIDKVDGLASTLADVGYPYARIYSDVRARRREYTVLTLRRRQGGDDEAAFRLEIAERGDADVAATDHHHLLLSIEQRVGLDAKAEDVVDSLEVLAATPLVRLAEHGWLLIH